LPLETQGYVPAFIAANYVMNYGPEHNLYPAMPRKTYFEVDTVVVKEQMTFEQISQALNISSEEILYFNPQYRKSLIPAGGNAMCLPKNKIAYFLNNEMAIYDALKAQRKEEQQFEVAEVKRIHTVKYGEKLSTIARKYGVSLEELRTWNSIGKKGVKPGRKLVVYVREQKAIPAKPVTVAISTGLATNGDTVNKQLAENNVNLDQAYIYHKVQKGETLYSLAIKYNVEAQSIINLNSLQEKNLSIGQLLKIKSKWE
jgi:membrane-bound lytic murein transglycosylase D